MTLRHRLAHRLGWQHGHVVSTTDIWDNVWVGFRCATCGEVTSPTIALQTRDSLTGQLRWLPPEVPVPTKGWSP